MSLNNGNTKKLFKCHVSNCAHMVRFGTQRCPEGHWIFWKNNSDGSYTLEPRTVEVTWPQKAEVAYEGPVRGSASHDGGEIRRIKPGERPVVLGRQGDWYALLGGGWVFHNQVVLYGRLAIDRIVSPFSDVTRVDVLEKPEFPGPAVTGYVSVGDTVTIWAEVLGWSCIDADLRHWVANMWLKDRA